MKLKTKGGLDATLFELDPDDLQDGISGMVYTPGMGDVAKSWNDFGICSNASDVLNIDPRQPAFVAVVDQLRAARP
ncbi:hypothetical protein [Pseudorhodoferax sp. Leaf265]|uniref:hypothetical protein n=1 Tax=Pseudorhodoferax sp. Leaf265 TaxID=1736315 RepID=UPI0012E7F343|nr:hypothetical protein [Pseudorhodoferax sp. Leaf265]